MFKTDFPPASKWPGMTEDGCTVVGHLEIFHKGQKFELTQLIDLNTLPDCEITEELYYLVDQTVRVMEVAENLEGAAL